MELTLDQALQKGIEAHKAGKVQEADQYYTAILKSQPNHPDANHNMGVLAVGVGKLTEALPFFKTAIQANQKIAQFWMSYIDALIKLDRIDEAKDVVEQARSNEAKGNGFEQVEQRLNKNCNLQERLYQTEKLPQEQLKSLMKLYNQGKLQQVFNRADKLTKQYPRDPTLWNLMGASAFQTENVDAAVLAFQKVLSIKPRDAQVFNNLGVALKSQGKFEEAITAYKEAVTVKPDYAEAYYNFGVARHDQGKLEEASEAYTKACSIKPDYAEAHYGMGHVFQDQGKLDDAVGAYKKVLLIKPNYAKVYNKLGAAFRGQGKLEEAIEAFNKVISLKPEDAEAWSNLYIPIQAMKLQIKSDQSLDIFFPKDIYSDYGKIELSLLDYKLHRGQESERFYFEKATQMLSSAENITIENPTFNVKFNSELEPLADNIVALVHFGRSGTGLIHGLIDGHPEVSTLPSIYLKEYFDYCTWLQIISGGWNRMVDNFVAIFDVLFDASSTVPIPSKSKKLLHSVGINDGMANVGNKRNEVLSINKKIFVSELKHQLSSYNLIDASIFFKLVHKAYDKALDDSDSKSLIFYHIHNPDTCAQLNFCRANPNSNWLVMVREPIQSCESWITTAFQENYHFGVASQIVTMLFEIDNIVYSKQNAIGVRLEDLKEYPRETIPALCDWMGINESEQLYEMTAQGKKWWGDPGSQDYSKDGMDPFGKTSINRKVGSILSKNDQFILRTMFYPFRVRFGYTVENTKQFNRDLQTIKPLLVKMFDFEKLLTVKAKISPDNFVKSDSYKYLRSGLIERWNTLNEFRTYPNMIRPLKI